MIKRYCDRCGQQIDEGVHAWYVLELHGTDGEFRHKELCEECYEYLCEKDEAPKADRKTENSSEKPNNCEHITEDGVTCAKYPACDDCLDNPLNKVKGSERLVKGSEQTEPTISKMEQVEDETRLTAKCLNCANGGSYKCSKCDGEMYFSKMYFKEEPKDEPQTSCKTCRYGEVDEGYVRCAYYSKATEQDEPQTERPWGMYIVDHPMYE